MLRLGERLRVGHNEIYIYIFRRRVVQLDFLPVPRRVVTRIKERGYFEKTCRLLMVQLSRFSLSCWHRRHGWSTKPVTLCGQKGFIDSLSQKTTRRYKQTSYVTMTWRTTQHNFLSEEVGCNLWPRSDSVQVIRPSFGLYLAQPSSKSLALPAKH